MVNQKNKIVKGRDWTFIVYPESAPSNWRDTLNKTHLRWIESPLHDKDVNADGEVKKEHWHILLSYDGPVGLSAVKKITDELNCPAPQKIASGKGVVRYMIHMDNPEKFQYSKSEIIGHNGADVESYFELTATNKLIIMKDIIRYIYENEVDNYSDFLMHCIEYDDDWFDIAINSNTLAINKMIDAVWQKKRNMSETNFNKHA